MGAEIAAPGGRAQRVTAEVEGVNGVLGDGGAPGGHYCLHGPRLTLSRRRLSVIAVEYARARLGGPSVRD